MRKKPLSDDIANGGVELTVKRVLAKLMMHVGRICPRILSVDLLLFGKVVTIILVGKPQSGRSEEAMDRFYNDLSAEMRSKDGNCIVLADFNGRVGSSINGYGGFHGEHGLEIRKKW